MCELTTAKGKTMMSKGMTKSKVKTTKKTLKKMLIK